MNPTEINQGVQDNIRYAEVRTWKFIAYIAAISCSLGSIILFGSV
jgi:hypothetical protein